MSGNEHGMSEKAKGKQRAYPISTDAANEPPRSHVISVPILISLAIRFTDGSPDLHLEMAQDETGAKVTSEIYAHRPDLRERRLRLIHSGRPILRHTPLNTLQPASSVAEYAMESGPRKSLSAWSPISPTTAKESHTTGVLKDQNLIWIHCAVGDVITAASEDDSGAPRTSVDAPPAYDRFTDAGLSATEVQSIRNLFRRVLFGTGGSSSSAVSSSSYVPTPEQASQLEARWLDSITQPAVYEIQSSSHQDPTTIGQTPQPLLARVLSHLLPSSPHATPTRSATQGLLFAFFFPLIAAVVMDDMSRPAAFFDGGIWPELSSATMEAILGASEEPEPETQPDGEETNGETSGEVREEAGEGGTTSTVPRPSASERRERALQMAPDVVADTVPSNVFTEGMQTAIRAGLFLNFVCGFYLWLYAS